MIMPNNRLAIEREEIKMKFGRKILKIKNSIMAIILSLTIMLTLVSCVPAYLLSEMISDDVSTESILSQEEDISSVQNSDLLDGDTESDDTPAVISSSPEVEDETSSVESHIHFFAAATCISPEKCECGETKGSANGHSWSNATCTTAKTCTVCQEKVGVAAGHQYANGSCTVCGAQDSNYTPPQTNTTTYVLNTKTMKFHKLDCGWLPEDNREDTTKSREELINEGYEPCKRCYP